MGWMDDARRVPLSEVAATLGMAEVRSRGSNGWGCPPQAGCSGGGKTVRSRKHRDRRAPLERVGEGGWICMGGCNPEALSDGKVKGDALALVAFSLTGDPKPGRDGWATVRDWYAAQGWLTGSPNTRPSKPPPRPPAKPKRPSVDVAALLRAALPGAPKPTPVVDVAALLAEALPGRRAPPATVEILGISEGNAPAWWETAAMDAASDGSPGRLVAADGAEALALEFCPGPWMGAPWGVLLERTRGGRRWEPSTLIYAYYLSESDEWKPITDTP
jgi:hypothetical protein